MSKILLGLFFLLESTGLYAQSFISGRVEDKNNNGLSEVNIFIPELEKRTSTDSLGKFKFENIGKGVVQLQFTLVGYQTKLERIDMTNHSGDISIRMEKNSVSMEEVVVTSNQTELARDIPYPINTVSSGELQKSGQITLMEKLSEQPGVDIISGGNGIGKPVVRGLSFNRIVFYSMGTRVENQQWDDDHDAGVAEAGLDKVEIVYGPSALIYGADALGGALIFIDEKPAPAGKVIGDVNLGYFSNTRGLNADVGIKGSTSSGLFYMADINDQSHTDYIQGDDASENSNDVFAVNSKFNNLSGKAKIGIGRKWGMSKLSYSYLRSLTGIIVDQDEDSIAEANNEPFVSRSRKIEAPYQDVDIQIVSLENTFLHKTSKINLNGAYQVNNRKEFEPVEPGEPQYTAMGLLLRTFTYDAKWSSNEEKKFGIVTGIQGMHQTNKNFGHNIAVPDADINNLAIFSLLHYNPEKIKWKFLGGLRIDARSIYIKETNGEHEGEASLDSLEEAALIASGLERPAQNFKKNYYPFSFSLGSVYQPSDKIYVKFNLATGFTAPNYAQLSTFGKHEGTYRFEVGNADLLAEQNIEGDVNLMWNLDNFGLNFSAFYNHINDYIYLSPTSDYIYDLQVIKYEQGDADIHGGSAGIEFHPTSINFLKINSAFSLTSGILASGGHLPYIPSNKLISEIRLEKEKIGGLKNPYFSFQIRNYFAQNKPALYESASAGYTLFDAQVGIDFKLGELTLSSVLFCTNLFNISYYNHLSIVKDIGIFEMGRNVGIKFHLPIGY